MKKIKLGQCIPFIVLDASQHNEKYLQGTLLVKSNGTLNEQERGIAESINF